MSMSRATPGGKNSTNCACPSSKIARRRARRPSQKLNSTIYTKLKVKYSTDRKQPHQSPKESIEQGKASCTGLSILLSDACRSVAIPTRLVGTPLWTNKSGNHTWVEIWDGRWHFTGACEPDPKGLDHGWFEGNASQAKKDGLEHAIYAVSFHKRRCPSHWCPRAYAGRVCRERHRPLREVRTQQGTGAAD